MPHASGEQRELCSSGLNTRSPFLYSLGEEAECQVRSVKAILGNEEGRFASKLLIAILDFTAEWDAPSVAL